MCGRYYIEDEQLEDEMLARLAELQRQQEAQGGELKLGEIFPTNTAPVISAEGLGPMTWGYAGYKNKVINARSETAAQKPMFRRSLLERRCLLPASGYYEWQRRPGGGKTKQKYALYRPGHPMLYMAGLWREEQGENLPVFVILTREAAPCIAQIHDRMPVILPEAVGKAWVAGTAEPELLLGQAVLDIGYRAL